MRILGTVALAVALSACTSVRMVQRDGCWIRQTEQRPFKRVHEEIGPCVRAQPKWVDDRLTRLVQECVTQADWRWQSRALDAWSRGRPYPAQPAQEETLRTCMQEARVGLVSENEDLKRRVTELAVDRDAARAGANQERAKFQETLDRSLGRLQDSHDRIAGFLGEAAQKPAGTATATASATSDGKATNESGATLSSGSTSDSGASAPAAVTASAPVMAPAAPPVRTAPAAPEKARTPPRAARAPRPATLERAPPGCEVPVARPEAATAAAPAPESGAP